MLLACEEDNGVEEGASLATEVGTLIVPDEEAVAEAQIPLTIFWMSMKFCSAESLAFRSQQMLTLKVRGWAGCDQARGDGVRNDGLASRALATIISSSATASGHGTVEATELYKS